MRKVAVYLFVVAAETTVDSSQTFQACVVDTFQCTDPQFQVWVYRIFYQHGDVDPFQCVGNFLYGERIGCGTCAYPKDVDSCFQTFVNVFGSRYFGRNIHTCFFLHFLQPGKSFHTDSFETSRFGTRFPDTGTVYLLSFGCQLFGGFHYLFFSLCATRAGDNNRSFGFDAR